MKKFSLFGILLIAAGIVNALPTISVPNLTYATGVADLGINNADVKGALINSGKFTVIDVPPPKATPVIAKSSESSIATAKAESTTLVESAPVTANNIQLDDGVAYTLIGQVASADAYNNYYQVPNSDNYTGTRTLSLVVNYKLLRTKDHATIASFNAYATGTQTVILKYGELIHPNQAMILRDASQNLAENVLGQLTGQMDNTTKFGQKNNPIITDVKTYD